MISSIISSFVSWHTWGEEDERGELRPTGDNEHADYQDYNEDDSEFTHPDCLDKSLFSSCNEGIVYKNILDIWQA